MSLFFSINNKFYFHTSHSFEYYYTQVLKTVYEQKKKNQQCWFLD